MAYRPALFTQADIKRAVKGALDAGLPVGAFEIDRTGKIVVRAADNGQPDAKNDWD